MHRKGITTLFFLLSALLTKAQQYSVQGEIRDYKGESAVGASAILLSTADSSLIKGTTADEKATFYLGNIPSGKYLLKIVYLGCTDVYKNIEVTRDVHLRTITLKQSAQKLKEVTVETQAVMATQSGDTTSYNSQAFKVNKDASAEDLINKMPGITNTDGKTQVQGEDVKQVLVDGKPFFGEDPNTVLKNLPAEIIDKVQVFDKKSEQALFTGIDDGNTSKTINIVTKLQFRNGVFGKVYGGYGYEDKYKAGGVFNRFKDKKRFTVLVLSNNINEQNFSTEDLLGVVGSQGGAGRRGNSGGGSRGSRGGGQQNSSESFLVDIRSGVIITNAVGINYSDNWSKKTDVSGSYFYNQTDNKAGTDLIRNYILGGNNGLNYSENSNAGNMNDNHRLNFKFEHKFDSVNSIIIQPRASLQINSGNSQVNGVNKKYFVISETDNSYKSSLQGYSFSLPFILRHSFAKKGRTLSLDVNPSITGSSGNSRLETYNSYYIDTLITDTIDQKSTLNKEGFNSVSNLTYTEPVGKQGFISANYIYTYNRSSSEKNTYNRNYTDFSFTERDTLLSNIFSNIYSAHAAGLSYRYRKEAVNFSLGLNAQEAYLFKQQEFPATYSGTKKFRSILPNAQFQLREGPTKNLRINYRTNNTPPLVDQLQEVVNNSNPLQLSTGNPMLKQNFQNNLSLRYSAVNVQKSTSLFVLLGGTYTNDYIGNSTIVANKDTIVYNSVFLAGGSQISRPDNMNDYYNLRFLFNYSFAIKKLKSNININTGCTYNNIPALINGEYNYSKTTSPSLGLVISSNISEKIDFILSSNSSYNINENTLQKSNNSSYLNQISKAKLNLNPWKGLIFTAEYSHTFYNGLTDGFNQEISLLNAALGYKFLKDKNADIRVFAFDLLQQNKNIQRNITETYIEDTETNNIQRYFMLIFTYNFKKYVKNENKKAMEK